jgi:putative ABC transport system permease protein
MVFIPVKDAQEAQFLKDNDAIWQQRHRTTENPAFNRPQVPGLLEAVIASQSTNPYVNAVLVQVAAGHDPEEVAASIRRWKRLTVYTRSQMETILIGKLIATSAKQIGMFLVILSIVSAAIVAFIIYTLTLGKIREIAVLKLIGTKNHTIVGLIMQQAIALGVIGFVVGKITATLVMAPIFPKYVLLEPIDSVAGFGAVVVICMISSIVAIRAAMKVDPAEAIGG